MAPQPIRRERLSEYMRRTPDTDVKIEDIYAYVFGALKDEAAYMAQSSGGVRYMQQSLGPVIKRFNEVNALNGEAIRPGRLKQTYRLENALTGG